MSRSVRWLTVWLFVLAGLWVGVSGANAQDASSLTLQVYVCPEGVEPADPWAECGDRVATEYDYWVSALFDSAPSQEFGSGESGGNAVAWLDLTGDLPGTLRIGFPSFYWGFTGVFGFDCSIDGVAVNGIEIPETAAGYPIYQVDVEEPGDLVCTLVLGGFDGDTDSFGIVGDEPTVDPPAGGLAPGDSATANAVSSAGTTTDIAVVALPATGTGHAPAGLPLELAGFGVLLAASALVVRRRFAIR